MLLITNLPTQVGSGLVREEFSMQTYFCDTHSPWQKGTVENTNARIRRFLPRKTTLKNITLDELKQIQHILNNTPRKCLNYKTPNEAFKQQLK